MSVLQRIFYVEDEVDIQTVAKIALEIVGGLTVKVCSSGAEALLEVEAFAPDMILLDVMMPDMDGVSLLKELQKIPAIASVPVVFMTAKVLVSEIESLKRLGAIAVISKPFDPMTLSDQVKTLWEQFNAQ